MFAECIYDKELLFRIYKGLLQLNNKKTTNPIIKWAKDLNGYVSEEDIQMASKHVTRCSISITTTVINDIEQNQNHSEAAFHIY